MVFSKSLHRRIQWCEDGAPAPGAKTKTGQSTGGSYNRCNVCEFNLSMGLSSDSRDSLNKMAK